MDISAMMIDVTVADLELNVAVLYTQTNPTVAGADMVRQSGTWVVFSVGRHDRYIVTNLHWAKAAISSGMQDRQTNRSH